MELVIVLGAAGLLVLALGLCQLAFALHWTSKYGED